MKRRHLRWALPLLAGAMVLFPSTSVRGQQLPRPPQGLVAQSPSTSSTRTMREEADRQFRSGSFNRAIQIWSVLIARGQDLQDSLSGIHRHEVCAKNPFAWRVARAVAARGPPRRARHRRDGA